MSAKVGLGVIGVGFLVGLRWHLFHDLVPNTFHAKVPLTLNRTCFRGVEYLFAYTTQYGVAWPCFLVCATVLLTPKSRTWVSLFGRGGSVEGLDGAMLATCVLWCLYLVWVGGDFMEFRFWYPSCH